MTAPWEKLDDRTYQPHAYRAASDRAAEWAGWGTALKPAWEPIALARKPLDGTVAANVLAHGCGGLNIDECRIEATGRPARTNEESASGLTGMGGAVTYGEFAVRGSKAIGSTDVGRWPANVIHDGSDEVNAAFPLAPGALAPGALAPVGPQHGPKASVNTYGDYGPRQDFQPRGDEGSAARFFYAAKAGPYDRFASKHPTVKPVDLMRWLARLVTPPGGTILDPFAGTGTTGAAAMAEGFDCILMEREAEYVADIKRRIAWMQGDGPLTAQALSREPQDAHGDLPLFADANTAQPADASSDLRPRRRIGPVGMTKW